MQIYRTINIFVNANVYLVLNWARPMHKPAKAKSFDLEVLFRALADPTRLRLRKLKGPV